MEGSLEFEVKNYRCFEDSQPLTFSIQKGAIAFTGPNNSGKSSILKFIYEFKILWAQLQKFSSNLNQNTAQDLLRMLLNNNAVQFGPHDCKDPNEFFTNLNNRDLKIKMKYINTNLTSVYLREIEVTIGRTNRHIHITARDSNNSLIAPTSPGTNQGQAHPFSSIISQLRNIDLDHIREFFISLSSAFYIGAFRNAINEGKGRYLSVAIGTQFIEEWNNWKTGYNKSQNQSMINVSDQIKELFDFQRFDITATADKKNLNITIDNSNYRLDELGAGIAQFIVVLGNLAIHKPNIVLIDEPELNLHPSLQIKFLQQVELYAKNTIMFSTHSLGLARSYADTIYSVKKVGGGNSSVNPWANSRGYLELAGELSYSCWPDIGAGKVLLVEGVTEVKAVQHFLRLLKKDKDVLVIPLGGGQLINGNTAQELDELNRLNAPISVLIDSEKSSATANLDQDRQDFITNCQGLGFTVHVLDKRAFENYLTDDAIKLEKGSSYSALTDFQAFNTLNPRWGKSENWKIATHMSLQSINGNDLGTFLNSL